MAINYVDKHMQQVEEAFTIAAITEAAINKDYDFVGAQTIKIHSVPTVAMGDYTRSGSSRYGNPSELEDTVQELTMGKDRAFTYTVDKMNSEEDQALNAGKALRRQVDQVVIPEVDKYRLARMAGGAGISRYGGYTTTGYYERFIDLMADMDTEGVPSSGRIAYVSNAFYKGLKLDDNFIDYAKLNQEKLIAGQIGECDGVKIIKGLGRMPAGVDLMICHPVATTAPYKLSEYKQHVDPPGINGVLVEGRNYFDCFILDKKRKAIGVHRSELITLTVTNAAGASGKTKFTAVSGDKGELNASFGTLCYAIAASITAPALGDDISNTTNYPELTLNTDITCTASHKYRVLLKDRDGKCIGICAEGTVARGA